MIYALDIFFVFLDASLFFHVHHFHFFYMYPLCILDNFDFFIPAPSHVLRRAMYSLKCLYGFRCVVKEVSIG